MAIVKEEDFEARSSEIPTPLRPTTDELSAHIIQYSTYRSMFRIG